MMKTILLSALVAFSFSSPGALAASQFSEETSLAIQRALEEQFTQLLKAYDPAGVAVVRAELMKDVDKPLPGTPYSVQSLVINGSNDRVQFSKIQVTLLTRDASAPDEVRSFVTDVCRNYGVTPTIRNEKLPAEIKSQSKDSNPAAPMTERETMERLATGLDKLSSSLESIKIAFFGFCALTLAAVGALALRRSRPSRELLQAMERNFAQLATAIGEGASSREISGASVTAATGPASTISPSNSGRLEKYSDEALLECLADCYWSEQDGYAAFLWRSIPFDTRQGLISKAPFLAEYTGFLKTVQATDFGYIEDPAYLTPAGFWSADNSAISRAVESQAALYRKLSKIRAQNISLSITEKVRLAQAEAPQLVPMPKLAASAPRKLRARIDLQIRTIEEERELLEVPSLTQEAMQSIPSLGWSRKLADAALQEILREFSARDLASAWIAPGDVLDRLSHALPEKKRENVLSIIAKNPNLASRQSGAFFALHRKIIDRLELQGDYEQKAA